MFIECARPDIRTSRSTSRLESHRELIEVFPEEKINEKNHIKSKEVSETPSFRKENKEPEKIWKKLLEAYEEHRIDEANDLKNEYREKNYKITKEQEELFSTIELEYKTMMQYYV